MDGWNTTFQLGRPIFRGYVSFREGNMIWIVYNVCIYIYIEREREREIRKCWVIWWSNMIWIVFVRYPPIHGPPRWPFLGWWGRMFMLSFHRGVPTKKHLHFPILGGYTSNMMQVRLVKVQPTQPTEPPEKNPRTVVFCISSGSHSLSPEVRHLFGWWRMLRARTHSRWYSAVSTRCPSKLNAPTWKNPSSRKVRWTAWKKPYVVRDMNHWILVRLWRDVFLYIFCGVL